MDLSEILVVRLLQAEKKKMQIKRIVARCLVHDEYFILCNSVVL
jgi:hypothetical protein